VFFLSANPIAVSGATQVVADTSKIEYQVTDSAGANSAASTYDPASQIENILGDDAQTFRKLPRMPKLRRLRLPSPLENSKQRKSKINPRLAPIPTWRSNPILYRRANPDVISHFPSSWLTPSMLRMGPLHRSPKLPRLPNLH